MRIVCGVTALLSLCFAAWSADAADLDATIQGCNDCHGENGVSQWDDMPTIGGMDAFARGLKTAARIRSDQPLADVVQERYSSYDEGIGKRIEQGHATFSELEAYMTEKGEADANQSGRQEMLENMINWYL